MIIGYARVSTQDQTLDVQLDKLNDYGCDRIFSDVASGVRCLRPGLEDLFSVLRDGDKLVLVRLDRLGRSLADLIKRTNKIFEMKVELVSLTESIDTSTPAGRMMIHMISVFAQFELDLLQERTRDGIEAARKRGRIGGRKHALKKKDRRAITEMYESGKLSVKQICESAGISRQTLYNYRDEENKK